MLLRVLKQLHTVGFQLMLLASSASHSSTYSTSRNTLKLVNDIKLIIFCVNCNLEFFFLINGIEFQLGGACVQWQFHWTRYDTDTCPYPNVSCESSQWTQAVSISIYVVNSIIIVLINLKYRLVFGVNKFEFHIHNSTIKDFLMS